MSPGVNDAMALRNALRAPPRTRSSPFVIVAAVVLFLENVARSYQYSVREGTTLPARTALDWVVGVGGSYLVVPGLLVVAYYALSGLGGTPPLTGRFLVSLFAGVLAGSLLGQYVGVAPHPLVALLTSKTFAAEPATVRLWLDVFGAISREFLVVLGGVVLARVARRGHWSGGDVAGAGR